MFIYKRSSVEKFLLFLSFINMKKKKKSGFSKSKLFNLLLTVFKNNANKKLNYKQVSKILNIKNPRGKVEVVEQIEMLKNNGLIQELQRGSYRLAQNTTTAALQIKKSNKSGVFVNKNDAEDIFIPKEFSHFALAGDIAEVLIFPKNKKNQQGEIVKIIKRKKDRFIGVIDDLSSHFFLTPDDKKIPFDIYIPKETVKQQFLNMKVLVKVEGWNSKYKNPVGKVIQVIGPIDNHNTEINSILLEHGYSDNFPDKVIAAANKVNTFISKKEIQKRKDIRNVNTFTIDPENAKDFDDAISVQKLSSNNWEIGVHIADVAHYVVEDGEIDKEAYKRATSVYLVDRVIPMLPELLSNEICSLKPDVDRLVFSVFFEIDEKANIKNYKIKKTIIKSDCRFTYKSAQKIINAKKGKFKTELLLLEKLSKILREKRTKNGSINFEKTEPYFVLDKNNNPIDVSFKETLSTNHLIEEFMLLANKTIASYINLSKKNKIPFIYRVHDIPDKESIKSLKDVVKKFGHIIKDDNPTQLSQSLNKTLSKSKGKREQKLIETLIIKSMAKAIYTTKNIGHYGLAFKNYTHFTSPIRRYTDLIVHRVLQNYIFDKKHVFNKDLRKLCKHCSEMEKSASEAERDSQKYMQIKFLKNHINKVFSGIISGVTEWGLYVELIENKCEGLVKISSLKDDHYIFNQKDYCLIGYQKKNKYQLGQKIEVKIKKADLNKKQIDFIII